MLSSIAVLASFELEKPDNRVEYDIWFTSSNDKALDFIEEFAATDAILGASVLMTPHYVFWKCPYCDGEVAAADCWAGGKYCAIESSNENILGKEIVLEDLRQKCLYN